VPSSSPRDLAQVAQFMGVRRKDEMIKIIKDASPPDLN